MVGGGYKSGSVGKLRVLMQMRPNALTQRGGDTVVMERITEGLRKAGHEVVLDLEEHISPHSFDIVHLYNFATPEVTQRQAKRSVEANVPFIVTTMYEDWPFFFMPMVETFLPLEKYIQSGQQPGAWQQIWDSRERIPPSDKQDNTYTAFHAAALVGTGRTETDALRRDYPESKLITDYRCGCEVSNATPSPELFRNFSGLKDFVLCVGRLEWRKNQLMLLKALEDSDLPLVLATGGFTYQADYEALCRAFQRKGKTVFLPKIEPELLASAFAASTVHVLPSFFELPGLVSLEAAKYGTNVVVSDYGTIRDYLGDDGIYCKPDSPESIFNAVMEGWNRPHSDRLQKRMEPFTWKAAAEKYIEIYSQVLEKQGKEREAMSMKQTDHGDLGRLDAALQTIAGASAEVSRAKETVSLIPQRVGGQLERMETNEEAGSLCNEGDTFTREGKLLEAANRFKLASQVSPTCARAFRGLGVVALNQGQLADSEGYFRRALMVDMSDTKSDIGIAAIQAQSGRKKEASTRLLAILEREPANLIALRQYLQLAYELDEFSQLESVLKNFLEVDGKNSDINFCLAGCFFKQDRSQEALEVIEKILLENATHAASLELKQHILKEVEKKATTEAEEPKETLAKPQTLIKLEELLRRNKFQETVELAGEVQKSLTEDSEHIVMVDIIKAEAMICLGQGEQAKEILDSHRDHLIFGYRATATLGVYWGSKNDWEKAARLFHLSIAIKHDHDVALAGLGIAFLVQGDRELSWEFFSRAHAANPENIRALTGMIELAYPLCRLDALEQALLKYLEYMPANLSILYAHAGCAYALGKKELAVEQLQKIKIFDDNHALANELLAKIGEERYQAAQSRA